MVRFQSWLLDNNLIHDTDVEQIEATIDAEIADSVDFAEAGTWEPIEDLSKHVMGDPPPAPVPVTPSGKMVEMTYREAVKQGIRDAMIRDERVFLMGEDVGAYGGCYAVSKGLMDEFGEDRIRDTPAQRVRVHRRRDWCGSGRIAPDRRTHDCELLASGA